MDDRAVSLLDMTVGIVANYVAKNSIKAEEVAGLIASTHAALSNVGEPEPEQVQAFDRATTGQVRKSITDTGLVSFIDGKTYQSLKRHLGTHGLSPDDYRERYGLPDTYPMVSPAYAARRSELAKARGFGKGGRKPAKAGRAKPAS